MEIHPHGVLPSGNVFTLPAERVRAARTRRDRGLGELAPLEDAIILNILDHLTRDVEGARTLASLAKTSKAMRAFASHEDLWKAATLGTYEGRFSFRKSWFQTYATAAAARRGKDSEGDDDASRASGKRKRDGDDDKENGVGGVEDGDLDSVADVRTEILSDALHQRYMCAEMELEPEWLETSTVPEATGEMSLDEFRERFEKLNLPVVIRGAAKEWPALKKWSRDALTQKFGDVDFVVGGYDMSLRDFFALSDQGKDDVPLYLFDPKFGEKAPELAEDYAVPDYFGADDLFKLLGDERPHHRWLIVGPARSGSSFHKDPNATSAWNAVITGRKKWVMFPPNVNPPGVHPSADGADVAQPLSLVEWFSNFYQYAYDGKPSDHPLECTCEPGDVLFVPSGWWHMAFNLEECVAVTQNFVSRANLRKVLSFLDTKCEVLVSGLSKSRRGGLGDAFKSAIRASNDAELASILDAHERSEEKRSQPSALGDAFTAAAGASFSFSFSRD